MARTALPIIDVPADYALAGLAFVFTAADATNFNSFAATGREILIAHNGDAAPQTVTIHSIADPYGRSGDITAESIAAGAYHVFQRFPLTGYVQSDNTVHIDASAATMEFAVLRLR